MTLHNTPIGTRIGMALALPIVGLLVFALWTMSGYQSISDEARDLRDMAELAPVIGVVVHELQQERGVSAGYVGSAGAAFGDRLGERREQTDRSIEAFDQAIATIVDRQVDDRLGSQLGAARAHLNSLPAWRDGISRQEVTVEQLTGEYSDTIAQLLNTMRVMLLVSNHSALTRSIDAYIHLVQAKEFAGIERAIGSARFSAGSFDAASQARLISLIDRQQLHLDQFRFFGHPAPVEELDRLLTGPEMVELGRMRRLALTSEAGGRIRAVDSTYWFDTMTWKIDRMKRVEDRLARELIEQALTIEESARRLAATVNIASLLIVLLAIVAAVLLAHGIIDPMTRVTQAMNKLAANNESVEISDQDRGDEIGDMARAAVVFRDNVGRIVQAEERLKSEAILRLHHSALASILQGVLIIDASRQIIYANAAFQSITGYAEDEMIGRTPEFLYGPDTDPKALAALRAALSAGDTRPHVVLSYRKDGTPFWSEVSVTPVSDSLGRPTHIVSVVRDITDSRRIEEELRIAAIAFESLHAMMVTDAKGVVLRVNRAFCETTGYSVEEMVGKSPSMLKSGRHPPEFYADMWYQLKTSGSWQGEVWDRRKNGDVFPKWQTISSVRGEDGEITHYVAAFSDITERKQAEEQIRLLAFYDPLTGLPNRRLLIDRLQQAVLASDRSARKGALLFIDLDQFKTINDTRGHDVGDLLLVEVGNRLQGCLRACDTAARFGGDEFVVMLEDLSEDLDEATEQARTVGEKILATLNEPYQLDGETHRSSPSIGVTLIRGRSANATELLKQADLAMYRSKAAGRNTMRFFEPGMTPGNVA
jgi:diguanylate cyclase (GGDEF)-like protein/PAS domain S-box-containing protein